MVYVARACEFRGTCRIVVPTENMNTAMISKGLCREIRPVLTYLHDLTAASTLPVFQKGACIFVVLRLSGTSGVYLVEVLKCLP